MKTYLTIIFLSISTITFSQDIENRLSDEKVKKIAAQLCDDIIRGRSNALDVPEWALTMRKMAGYTGSSKDFSKYFNNFLNKYNQNLICPCFDGGAEKYPAQHIYKRLLAADLEETYNEYFFEFENGDVDFNAYEIVNGKKETIVDWAERWIALGRGNPDDIRDIVSALQDEFGAKRASELPD
jgi:hypothetical protein|tara:strand:+ start:70 stop:618 length:549 start_codon:yes stop_codon:yes gene_type:complete